jgi:hypothetical protein
VPRATFIPELLRKPASSLTAGAGFFVAPPPPCWSAPTVDKEVRKADQQKLMNEAAAAIEESHRLSRLTPEAIEKSRQHWPTSTRLIDRPSLRFPAAPPLE